MDSLTDTAKTSGSNDTLSFYVPDLAPSIRAHVGNKRGALVEWFRQIARRDLIARGALTDDDAALLIASTRELIATKGLQAVKAKLDELSAESCVEAGT